MWYNVLACLLSSGELLQGGNACIDRCGHCCIFIPLSHSGMKNFGMDNEKIHRKKFQFSGWLDPQTCLTEISWQSSGVSGYAHFCRACWWTKSISSWGLELGFAWAPSFHRKWGTNLAEGVKQSEMHGWGHSYLHDHVLYWLLSGTVISLLGSYLLILTDNFLVSVTCNIPCYAALTLVGRSGYGAYFSSSVPPNPPALIHVHPFGQNRDTFSYMTSLCLCNMGRLVNLGICYFLT